MKKIIIALAMIPMLGFGQIEMKKSIESTQIGEAKRGGERIADLSCYYSDTDTMFYFSYKNEKYTHITDRQKVSFKGSETVFTLYQLFMNVFTDENRKNEKFKQTFTLGESSCSISVYRSFGVTLAWFWSNGSYVSLSEENVHKLFNR